MGKSRSKAPFGWPTAQKNTIRYDGVKPTLKSVSQDLFSAKKILGLNVTNLKIDLIRHSVAYTVPHSVR